MCVASTCEHVRTQVQYSRPGVQSTWILSHMHIDTHPCARGYQPLPRRYIPAYLVMCMQIRGQEHVIHVHVHEDTCPHARGYNILHKKLTGIWWLWFEYDTMGFDTQENCSAGPDTPRNKPGGIWYSKECVWRGFWYSAELFPAGYRTLLARCTSGNLMTKFWWHAKVFKGTTI